MQYNTVGGSEGGASMLWPPDSSGRYDTERSVPCVVSGGGGGKSTQLILIFPKILHTILAKKFHLVKSLNHIYTYSYFFPSPLHALPLKPLIHQ